MDTVELNNPVAGSHNVIPWFAATPEPTHKIFPQLAVHFLPHIAPFMNHLKYLVIGPATSKL